MSLTACRRLVPVALTAFALAAAACSRGSSGDDGKPAATATAATAAATPATPTLAAGVYSVNKVCETYAGLVLTRVSVERDFTRLDFTYTNNDKKADGIHLANRGKKDAMFLEQPDGKKLPIITAEGIAFEPAETTIPAGDSVKFTITFGALDPGVRKFSMYEGEDTKKAMPGETTYWIMHDIELK